MKEFRPRAIVIHGGSGNVDMTDPYDAYNLKTKLEALAKIVRNGWEELSAGKTSLDVVTNTIVRLEDAEPFNAGYGSSIGIDAKGKPLVALDASIMIKEGDIYRFGGVTGITNMQNPILVARAVLDQQPNILHGEGANDLAAKIAKQYKKPILDNKDLMTEFKWHKFQEFQEQQKESTEGGTVGVVVFDGTRLVAGTSTGGITGKLHGRTGDSCIPGAGTFADTIGGASATGFGEAIMIYGSTRKAIELLKEGLTPQEAADAVAAELRDSYNGNGGIIIANNEGEIGVATNTNHMPNAYMTNNMSDPVVRAK
ncbi:MAG: isoaspartyl peptidase/L-asparaginase [Candidatus Levybacteria bacterium]|nr:isoaspartyl peptidase/L-asparaginase [Candidatus Levybacteria bacterium]